MPKYSYQHSESWSKPSSESHRWSYERTCRGAQTAIEQRWGVDYRIVSIEFEDNDRKTKTETDWTGKRTWKCTHTVTAKYDVERRGNLIDIGTFDDKHVVETVTSTYKMLNQFSPEYDAVGSSISSEIPNEDLEEIE